MVQGDAQKLQPLGLNGGGGGGVNMHVHTFSVILFKRIPAQVTSPIACAEAALGLLVIKASSKKIK